jgi:type IV pilus assembly protein PilB
MPRKKLGELLIESGLINETQLRMALNEQKRWGGTLGRTLVEMKLVNEAELVRALSRQLNLPMIDLDKLDIPHAVIELVTGDLAQQHNLVPFAQQMKFLDVAMADPTNIGILDEMTIRTKLNIRPYLAGPKMIERAIGKYYGKGFVHSVHRPDLAIPIDTGDMIGGPSGQVSPPLSGEGIRPFPRGVKPATTPPPPATMRDAEVLALQDRISRLEALVARDEEVLRKLLALLVEKQVATRDEIVERLG